MQMPSSASLAVPKPERRADSSAAITAGPALAASVKSLDLNAGLYAITIGHAGDRSCVVGELPLPFTHVFSCSRDGNDGATMALVGDSAGWSGPEGGTIVVSVPAPAGRVVITTYRPFDQEAPPLGIQIAPLGQPAAFGAGPRRSSPAGVNGTTRAEVESARLPIEITVQGQSAGEFRGTGAEWIGEVGRKRPIEAFAIRAIDRLEPGDLEYKAFGPDGRETPWVNGGKLCGSRGRGLGLTGIAVRLAPHLAGRFTIIYQGAFVGSGISEIRRDGEPCLSVVRDEALEAITVDLLER
jgi:hypothetical protein